MPVLTAGDVNARVWLRIREIEQSIDLIEQILAGLPIVPVAVIGTRQVMPKGRLRTEPADVRLVVHDPIRPPAPITGRAPTSGDAKAWADRVHTIVSDSVDRVQDERSSVLP